MQNHPIGFPEAHIAIVNMIGFGAAAVKFQHLEVLSFFQVFNGSCFDIITAIVEFICKMTQLIKNFVEVFINFFVKVGKMCTPVVVTGIR